MKPGMQTDPDKHALSEQVNPDVTLQVIYEQFKDSFDCPGFFYMHELSGWRCVEALVPLFKLPNVVIYQQPERDLSEG